MRTRERSRTRPARGASRGRPTRLRRLPRRPRGSAGPSVAGRRCSGAWSGSALAIVAGIVAGATMLLPFRSDLSRPAKGRRRPAPSTGSRSRIPRRGTSIDPDEAGLNGPGPSTLPRIVLALSPHRHPPRSPARAWPTGAADLPHDRPGGTVGRRRAFGDVAGAARADDRGRRVGLLPDWEFLRAGWTARTGRSRPGRVRPRRERRRPRRRVRGLRVDDVRGATRWHHVGGARDGTAGGQEWSLIATREDDGSASRCRGHRREQGSEVSIRRDQKPQIFSTPSARARIGSSCSSGRHPRGREVEAVEASTAGGSFVSADVLDVPNKIDPDLNAFALVVPPGGTSMIRVLDASGNVVISGSVGGGPEASRSRRRPRGRPGGRSPLRVRALRRHRGAHDRVRPRVLPLRRGGQPGVSGGDRRLRPVPNDHFVVNDNPMLRTLSLAPDARLRLLDWNHCCDTFFDGDLRFSRRRSRNRRTSPTGTSSTGGRASGGSPSRTGS